MSGTQSKKAEPLVISYALFNAFLPSCEASGFYDLGIDKKADLINWKDQLNHQLMPQFRRHCLADGLVVENFNSSEAGKIEVRIFFDARNVKSISSVSQ